MNDFVVFSRDVCSDPEMKMRTMSHRKACVNSQYSRFYCENRIFFLIASQHARHLQLHKTSIMRVNTNIVDLIQLLSQR